MNTSSSERTPERVSETISVVGAGLAGSLAAIYLARRGYAVNVYERRPDIRTVDAERGRSINLALSHRGIYALEAAGIKDSAADITRIGIPMHGRMIHHLDGSTAFQPYGKDGECLYSVSRAGLNAALLQCLEALPNVTMHFGERCLNVDFTTATTNFEAADWRDASGTVFQPSSRAVGTEWQAHADRIVGADGAFSAVRFKMQRLDRFNYQQHYLDHGYKELTIPANPDGSWRLERNALHIWPRGRFMLIALPNHDGSFTCTLFLPFEPSARAAELHSTDVSNAASTQAFQPEPSFAALTNVAEVQAFFAQYFSSALPHLAHVNEEFFANPTASLVTVRCSPWHVGERAVLIGDSAHAITPFYGQGINAGFEDCRILNELLDEFHDDWSKALPAYTARRKPNGDAIAELAYRNFIEMSERVADPLFLLRKKIEKRLHERHPDDFVPVYSMVTFSHVPYADALREQERQNALFEEILRLPQITECWDTPALEARIDALFEQSRRRMQ
jgi:kynurenine 3-monooxygenase